MTDGNGRFILIRTMSAKFSYFLQKSIINLSKAIINSELSFTLVFITLVFSSKSICKSFLYAVSSSFFVKFRN